MTEPIVEFEDLRVHFPVFKGFIQRLLGGGDIRVHAVDGVSLSIREGEVFGLVGESGCGKSTIARALVGLVSPTSGTYRFQGVDVAHAVGPILFHLRARVGRTLRALGERGFSKSGAARRLVHFASDALNTFPPRRTLFYLREQVQMIHQDPHAALSPAMTAGQAIADVIRTHGVFTETSARVLAPSEDQVRNAVYRALEDVDLRPAKFFYAKYPDELSGGQKQRVVVGRVLALRPRVVVADEPLAMLDMSVRARMLEFLLDLKARFGLTYVFITHDLATAKFVCDRIAIMYLGRVVETGPSKTIYADPKHPYTRALLDAIPVPDPTKRTHKSLPRGEVPDAVFPPAGCRFHPRCPAALPTCGWEGRDLVTLLEERWLDAARGEEEAALGPLEDWWSEDLEAGRPAGADPSAVVAGVRRVLESALPALAQAVTSVEVDDKNVVVRFRKPDTLTAKTVEGRTVECLLY